MESRDKILGVIVALCAALATSSGLAQEDTPTADRDVPRANGDTDNGVAVKGLVIHAGPDGSRTGPARPPPPAAESSGAVRTDGGTDPVRPEGGSAGLRRRANLSGLIANAPKMATGSSASNTGIGPPLVRPGVDAGAARNAIGVVVPGGGHGFGHAVPGPVTAAGIGVRGPGSGVVGAGPATGNVGSADARRSAVAPNAVTSPQARTSGINGTTIGPIMSGPSYIGGPAKDRSGISGTAIRPKH